MVPKRSPPEPNPDNAGPPYRTSATRPDDGSEKVDVSGLGPLRRSHRAAGLLQLARPALTFEVTFVMMAVVLGITIDPRAGVFALGSGTLLAGVVFLFALRHRGEAVDLHAEGLVIRRASGVEVVAFDDVDELYLRLNVTDTLMASFAMVRSVELVDTRGVRCKVPLGVEDLVGLVNELNRRCSASLLPDALAAIRDGSPLTFANIRLTSEDITVDGATARWSELKLVRFRPGVVELFRRSTFWAWRTIKMDGIPHPTVFTKVVMSVAERTEVKKPHAMGMNVTRK
jgi:hypothetical protein